MAQERIYVNGTWQDPAGAQVSVDDRAFLFGDGVYEVVRLYDGRPFRLEAHLERLRRSQRAILLDPVDEGTLTDVVETLSRDALATPDAMIYLEISRGVSPRNHAMPNPPVPPTVVAWVRPVTPASAEEVEAGIAAITVPDDRWAKCWIKTVNLLPNVLAKERARQKGAQDALFVRDGMVIEGTSSNLFVVLDGVLTTAPVSNYILPGITREVVLELAAARGLTVRLEPVPVEHLGRADEVFLTGTTTEVLPVTRIDGVPVGSGMGPVARTLREAYHAVVGRLGGR